MTFTSLHNLRFTKFWYSPQIYSEWVFDTKAKSNSIDAFKHRKQSQNKLENKDMLTNNSWNSETSFFQQSQEEEKLINTGKYH